MMTMMPQPIPLRFKVDDYYRMIEFGMLDDYEKAEIIEGELIRQMLVGDRHAACVERLNEFLRDELGKSVSIRNQQPIKVGDYNEPQPDLAIVKRRDDFYGNSKPTGDNCLLLIEVSDSTLDYDRNKKLPLYAEGNIPEFWLVNLQNNTIEVHTEPRESVYSLIRVLRRGETIKSESVPNLQIKVDAILG